MASNKNIIDNKRDFMYYSLLIEYYDSKTNRQNNVNYAMVYDEKKLDRFLREVIRPYLDGETFIVDGYVLGKDIIKRIKIVETDRSIKEIRKNKQRAMMATGVCMVCTCRDVINNDELVKDITNEIFSKGQERDIQHLMNKNINMRKVFIVHGRDDLVKVDVARFLEQIGIVPIILHEQASQGKTIIEKIEEYSDVGYGIVLYTPCDKGGLNDCKELELKPRARQNVVFEHGYLIGKLGRNKVCALMKDDIEYPNDISGLVYIKYQNNDAWKLELSKELKKAGYSIDLNKLV